ncbi:MAG: hypothetical protein ABFD54_09480 [Armatimonadota bacterium]|nr:conjugal transfer protein TraF [bacterium]
MVLRITATLCVLVAMVTAACASDVNIGSYARSVAMGGAGLALIDNAASSSVVNPAAGIASGSKFQFIFPSIDLHSRGASIQELRDRTSEVSSGDTDDALTLAKEFGDHQTSLTLGFTTGFAGGLGVRAEGEAQALVNPGANFSNWVQAGAPTTLAGITPLLATGQTPDQYAASLTTDTYVEGKYIYSLPTITCGKGFGTGNGKLWLGTKLQWLDSEVRRWDITSAYSDAAGLTVDAVEVAKQEDSGLGADLGMIFQPKNSSMQWGLVVNNLINPSLKGINTERMFSAGIASRVSPNLVYAMDLVNINKAYNEKTKLRMGLEMNVLSNFALRAGYTGDEFTWGFEAFGINVAFCDNAPTMISQILRY